MRQVKSRIRMTCKGIELRIGPYQLPDRSPCIGLRQPESNFTDDLVTFIPPSPSIAAERHKNKSTNEKTAHTTHSLVTTIPYHA